MVGRDFAGIVRGAPAAGRSVDMQLDTELTRYIDRVVIGLDYVLQVGAGRARQQEQGEQGG